MAKNLVVFILFISTPYPTRHLQLVLEVRPRKTGSSGNFEVQGQQQVLSANM